MPKSSRNRPPTPEPRAPKAPSANAGEFPKMLYGPKHAQVIVKDPDEQLDQEEKGFREHPDEVVEPKKSKKKKPAEPEPDADEDDDETGEGDPPES